MNDDSKTDHCSKETSIQLFRKSSKTKEKVTHICDVCSKEFKKKDRLTRHKFIHLETKPYSCEICSKTFARVDHLQKHSRTHIKIKDDIHLADLQLRTSKQSQTTHKCVICPKEFSRKDSFNKHLTTHSGIKPFSCEICSKAFGRRDHLEKHFKIHSKGKSRESLSESNPETNDDIDEQDMETDLMYECEVEIHDPLEQEELNEDDLPKIEEKTKKIHKCVVCSKLFARKDTLRKHSMIHSGLKPFSCEICAKAFGRQDHMKKHLLTHPEYKLRTKTNSDEMVKVTKQK